MAETEHPTATNQVKNIIIFRTELLFSRMSLSRECVTCASEKIPSGPDVICQSIFRVATVCLLFSSADIDCPQAYKVALLQCALSPSTPDYSSCQLVS